MKECTSDKYPLLHAVGIMRNVVVGSFQQTDLLEHLVDSSRTGAVESCSESKVLSAGHAFVEILMFGNNSDQRFEAALFSRDVTTNDSGGAGRGSQLAG